MLFFCRCPITSRSTLGKASALSMSEIGHMVYSPFVEVKLKWTSTNPFVSSHSTTTLQNNWWHVDLAAHEWQNHGDLRWSSACWRCCSSSFRRTCRVCRWCNSSLAMANSSLGRIHLERGCKNGIALKEIHEMNWSKCSSFVSFRVCILLPEILHTIACFFQMHNKRWAGQPPYPGCWSCRVPGIPQGSLEQCWEAQLLHLCFLLRFCKYQISLKNFLHGKATKTSHADRIHKTSELTWNLKTTQLKRKIVFQTIIFRFHVNLPGWKSWNFSKMVWRVSTLRLSSCNRLSFRRKINMKPHVQ